MQAPCSGRVPRLRTIAVRLPPRICKGADTSRVLSGARDAAVQRIDAA